MAMPERKLPELSVRLRLTFVSTLAYLHYCYCDARSGYNVALLSNSWLRIKF